MTSACRHTGQAIGSWSTAASSQCRQSRMPDNWKSKYVYETASSRAISLGLKSVVGVIAVVQTLLNKAIFSQLTRRLLG